MSEISEDMKNTHRKCTSCFHIRLKTEYREGNTTCTTCNQFSERRYKKVKTLSKAMNDADDDYRMCPRCAKIKEREDFMTKTGIYGMLCGDCLQQGYDRKERYNAYYAKLKNEMGGCIECGENDLRVLDFDHIDPDEKGCGVSECQSVEALQVEVEKCVLRCAICHIRRSKDQFNWGNREDSRKRKEFVDRKKVEAAGCEECGFFEADLLEALHWDHLDRSEKFNNVSEMVATYASLDDIEAEITKCRLLCANCHRRHTYDQMGYTIYDEFL